MIVDAKKYMIAFFLYDVSIGSIALSRQIKYTKSKSRREIPDWLKSFHPETLVSKLLNETPIACRCYAGCTILVDSRSVYIATLPVEAKVGY